MSIRVLLDLSELKIESFNYVWVNVAPNEIKCIRDFKSVLLRKFNFESENIDLFVREGFLLDEETINVLREDDVVRVQYQEKPTSGIKRNHTEYNGENVLVQLAKRLKKNSDIKSTIENEVHLEGQAKKKKKKSKTSSNLSFIENVVNHFNEELKTSNSIPVINPKNNVCKDFLPQANKNISLNSECLKDNSNDELFETAVETPKVEVMGNNCKKKKRKRHRKRKDVPLIDTPFLNNSQDEIIPSFAVGQSTVSDNSSCIRKHIRFTSPGPCPDRDEKETLLMINKGGTYSNESSVSTRNLFSSVSDKTDSSYMSSPAVENTYNYAGWTVSSSKTESFNTSSENKTFVPNVLKNECFEKSSNNNVTDIKQKNSITSRNRTSGRLNYCELPPLNHMPAVGSQIVYKILELNEYYSPEVSNFKEGIIKNIDPHTDEMEIELLEEEIKPGRTGKFENLQEDEVPPCEVKKFEKVTWSCLIEPKLISC